MVDKTLILRKFVSLDEYFKQIEEYSKISIQDYENNWKTQRIIDRTLQMMIETCKEKLKHIWTYRSRTWAAKALDHWCDLARSLNIRSVNTFVNMLQRHRYGIINRCDYPIHTGKLEGVNNKIKVIKRKAYGFHDLRYFTLKIYQAFSN